ncbi:hypothetical protein VPH35_112763 [Triticum aestivum]
MDAAATTADLLSALAPSWSAAVVLASYLAYLAAAAALLPGKLVAVLPDSSRLHYRCNGLLPLPLLLGLSALGVYMGWMTPTVRSTVGFLASALPPHHRPVRHVEARREGQAAQAGQGRREGLPRVSSRTLATWQVCLYERLVICLSFGRNEQREMLLTVVEEISQ